MSSRKRLSSLAAALILGAILVPGVASAAPADPQVIVFGHVAPTFDAVLGASEVHKTGDPGWDDPVKGHDVLFANSAPFGTGIRPGAAYFYGLAEPDMLVDITVTDGVQTIGPITIWTAPASASQHIDGYVPGQFGVGVPTGQPRNGGTHTQDDYAAITVTDLGVHTAEIDPDINPDGPASTDPAHWGGSELTFSFTVRDPADQSVSSTVTDTLTKYAGTPHDNTVPRGTGGPSFPPTHWCHTSGHGANFPGSSGSHLGGDGRGQCSSVSQAPFGALPDVTWVLCLQATSNPQRVIDPTLPESPFRSFYCRYNEAKHTPSGEAAVAGKISDDTQFPTGFASEIADVKIEVLRGSAPWLDPQPQIVRSGTEAVFGTVLKIGDFEPSYPNGDTYLVRVTVTDAWGKSRVFASSNINVYPW